VNDRERVAYDLLLEWREQGRDEGAEEEAFWREVDRRVAQQATGDRASVSAFCSTCGTPTVPGARYCASCGAALVGPGAPPESDPSSPRPASSPPVRSSRSRKGGTATPRDSPAPPAVPPGAHRPPASRSDDGGASTSWRSRWLDRDSLIAYAVVLLGYLAIAKPFGPDVSGEQVRAAVQVAYLTPGPDGRKPELVDDFKDESDCNVRVNSFWTKKTWTCNLLPAVPITIDPKWKVKVVFEDERCFVATGVEDRVIGSGPLEEVRGCVSEDGEVVQPPPPRPRVNEKEKGIEVDSGRLVEALGDVEEGVTDGRVVNNHFLVLDSTLSEPAGDGAFTRQVCRRFYETFDVLYVTVHYQGGTDAENRVRVCEFPNKP
jgi:hypothetical protein